jgi:Skp family chaperone for outer membrane proteins
MNKLLRAGGVLLLLGVLVLAGRSWSDTKPTAAPQTRIALVNIAEVLKTYEKAKKVEVKSREDLQVVQKRIKALQAQVEEAAGKVKDLDEKAGPEKRKKAERNLKRLRLDLDELQEEQRTALTKRNEEQAVNLYKEIMAAAQRHAAAHDFDLVLHYADAAPDAPEYWQPANVARKLQMGACFPLSIAPGLEITREVVAALNASYRKEKTAADPDEP